ncbi:hypothetical protein OBBRIDRAFT_759176 [Obba rivulosa]|uniref:Peptidase S54 rhomboid domain-containing protein n=1 Tax=Obba rivulosa TaxID=1052685 RepID=A0A8E2ATP3_9APHY|nr:hypothetical protein OBBRIDRAFT_759176 [Obba rivulosa]
MLIDRGRDGRDRESVASAQAPATGAMLWTCRPCSTRSLRLDRVFRSPPRRSVSLIPQIHPLQSVFDILGRHGAFRTPSPSFAEQLARTGEIKSFSKEVGRPRIRNQILFCVFSSIGVFTFAMWQTNDATIRAYAVVEDMLKSMRDLDFNARLRLIHEIHFRKKWVELVARPLLDRVNALPRGLVQGVALAALHHVHQLVVDSNDFHRVCWSLGALNVLVFAMWRFRSLRPFMTRHFTHDPLSGKSYTLFTSMFSHRKFTHLILSCMALSVFGRTFAIHWYQWCVVREHPESTQKWHMLAFITSGGLWAMLLSHIAVARVQYPRLLSRLTRSAFLGLYQRAVPKLHNASRVLDSAKSKAFLGLSGAIHSLFTFTALVNPDVGVALGFLPEYAINMCSGLYLLTAFNLLGVLRGWSTFNHWGNLGGIAFGAFYWVCGDGIWMHLKSLLLSVKLILVRIERGEKPN